MKSSLQEQMPLMAMLETARNAERVSFHIPGHNRGLIYQEPSLRDVIRYDTTELSITGDLNDPAGAVREAQKLAADAFGAARTFFITTGASIAIRAVLCSMIRPGGKIILFRAVHASVIHACMACHAVIVFTSEEFLHDTLAANRDACAVFITRPDYYGRCLNITRIARIVHSFGQLLIVDEAHGAHFVFSPDLFPLSALQGGGDIVVQSAYKTLPALTQGAMIHWSERYAGIVRQHACFDAFFKQSESIYTESTSSPSFLIAASMDFARHYMAINGLRKADELYQRVFVFIRRLVSAWRGCMSQDYILWMEQYEHSMSNPPDFDFTRMVLDVNEMPFTVRELHDALEKAGIYIEFTDFTRLVFLFKFDQSEDEFLLLADTMNAFIAGHHIENRQSAPTQATALIDRIFCETTKKSYDYSLLSLKKYDEPAFYSLSEAAGRTLASCLIPFPPGIPLVLPLDILTPEIIDLLGVYIENNWPVRGVFFDPDATRTIHNAFVKCFP